MKKKKTLIKIASGFLAVAMVLGMVIPAFAAEDAPPYQVTIVPNDYIATPTGDDDTTGNLATRFGAYQIFAGSVNDGSTFGTTGENFGTVGTGELGNVTWGSGINSGKYSDLLSALCNANMTLTELGITNPETADARYTGASTLGDLFKKGLEYAGYTVTGSPTTAISNTKDADLSKSAVVAAQVLSDFNSSGSVLAEAFAKIVGSKTGSSYNYLGSAEANSVWKNGRWAIGSTTGTGNGGAYQAGDKLAGGYYLIIDEKGNGEGSKGKSVSDFFAGVFGNVTIYTKTDAPEMSKEIVNGSNAGGSFETREAIIFELKGTLPSNFANYDGYELMFHDKMDPGLSYKAGSAKVYISVKNPLYTSSNGKDEYLFVDITSLNEYVIITPNPFDEDTIHFKVGDIRLAAFRTALNNAFHTQYGSAYASYTVAPDAGSEIKVIYTAYLNEGVNLSSLTGNKNTAHMEYTSDPNHKETTEDTSDDTSDSQNYLYDFGMQIHKYDGTSRTEDPLAGAGFAVTKDVTGPLYALQGPGGERIYLTASELSNYGITVASVDKTADGTSITKTLAELGADDKGINKAYSDYKLRLDGSELLTMATGTYYAVLSKGSAGAGSDPDKYYVAGWITEAEMTGILDTHAHVNGESSTTGTPDGTVSADEWKVGSNGLSGSVFASCKFLGENFNSGNTYYIAAVTPDNGNLRIIGLKDGTYKLNEVYAPAGFDPVKPITVEYDAEYYAMEEGDHPAGSLKSLTVTVTNSAGVVETKVVDGGAYQPDNTDLAVYFGIANNPVIQPPGTGGNGVYLIYGIGGILIAGALVIYAVMRSRKRVS